MSTAQEIAELKGWTRADLRIFVARCETEKQDPIDEVAGRLFVTKPEAERLVKKYAR